MDSDEEYSDYEWDAIDGIEINDTNKAPSFETLTADEIVKLMNQNIEHVNAIVQVSDIKRNVYSKQQVSFDE